MAAEEANAAAEINEVLSTAERKPLVIGAAALVAVIAAGGLARRICRSQGPRPCRRQASTASSPKAARGREGDVVMADLKPGVDGGSTGEVLPFALQRQVVFYRTTVVPGSIVVDRENRFLYLIDINNSARRYGIGIAQERLRAAASSVSPTSWNGRTGESSARAPRTPTLCSRRRLSRQSARCPRAAARQARTAHRRHAFAEYHRPSRRFRMHPAGNDDVEDLYRRVSLETRVVFVS